MNRPVPEELISAYFDGELTAEDREQVENLLGSSDELRQLLDDTSKLSALLHSFPHESAPAELARVVRTKTEAMPVSSVAVATAKRTSFRREWMAFGAGTLATTATLLLVYITLEQSRDLASTRGISESKSPVALAMNTNDRPDVPRQKAVLDGMSAKHLGGNAVTFGEIVPTPALATLESARDAAMSDGVNETLNPMTGGGGPMIKTSSNDSQYFQDFLDSLTIGDLVVRQVVDADNAIAVGEFRVVDVAKAVDGIKVLLQKVDVQKVDGQDIAAATEPEMDQFFEAPLKDQKKKGANQNPVDDLDFVYVRARGDRLAEMIKESLKDHPEIFKSFEAQLPIGLPAMEMAASTDDASHKLTEKIEKAGAANVPQTVSFEGQQAVNSYANSNGLVNVSTNSVVSENRLSKRTSELNNPAEGYTTIRVAADQQRKGMNQEVMGRSLQQFAVAKKGAADAASTKGLIPLQNSLASQGGNLRFRSSRSAADQRDARLVRMLIVLKPEANSATP